MMTIRASKLARPMVCAGFLFLSTPEPEGGEPAKEGTAAGEYLQHLLEEKPVGQIASNGVYFDDDMRFYTTPIYHNIKHRAAGPVICEGKIKWQTRSGIWIQGSYDASFVDKRGYLCIDDLKYGWNIVEVQENWQLIAYAIGEVIRRGQAFTHISFTIHQPRAHHEDGDTREWVITYDQLLGYKEKIEKRMEEIVAGQRGFQTSNQCKYCKGAAEACPAFSRLFYRALEVSREFVQDSLTDEEVARQLDHISRASEVLKIKKDSLFELGTSRIKAGRIIPGYIHTSTYSNRQWKPDIGPEAIKAMTGINVVETKFMSPAKAEKMGVSKELVKGLSVSVMTGTKLEKKDSSKVLDKIFGNNNPTGGN